MRTVVVMLAIAACGGRGRAPVHHPAHHRDEAVILERCGVLAGPRHDVCLRLGPPTAPDRERWATATWWYYETQFTGSYDGNADHPARNVCAQYVTFDADQQAVPSDEQCRVVEHRDAEPDD